jgi:hypothetical protein
MVRLKMLVVLIAVISLSFSVIWPSEVVAAGVPQIEILGQLQEGLVAPGSLDIDAQGNVYVADARAHKIFKFDAVGTLLQTFSSVSVTGSALAVNPAGTLIYATTTDGRFSILNGETGAFVQNLGTLTTSGDIAVDAQGAVYVVDTDNTQIIKYGTAGEILGTISGFGSSPGLFRKIERLTINPDTGKIYVVGEGVAVNYTAGGSSIVQIFDAAGNFDSQLTAATDFNGVMPSCKAIAFGTDGLEFYLDQSTSSVRMRDRVTGYLSTETMKDPVNDGIGSGKMKMPVDMVYDATSDRLLVASANNEIEIFGVNGGQTPALNQPPTPPVLVSPIAGGVALSTTPQLRFLNSTDANADDVLSYDVEISGLPLLSTSQYTGSESYVTAPVLQENALYTWKAQARDQLGAASVWTAAQSFFVNAVEEAPTAPILTSVAGATLNGAGLAWSESTDPDPNDSVFYRVEVAEDITYTDLILSAQLTTTEIQLNTFADYADLQDGVNYVWRVTAVDTKNLSTSSSDGSFVYDTAVLKVSANMPDAIVSLSGNAAYAGSKIGVAPIEFRDIAPGAYTIVVERAGCEQFITQVEITETSNADISAVLNLAVAPSLRNDADLRVGKSKLRVGMSAAPFAVDFNNDGMIDLLVGDETGTLTLFVAAAQRGSRVQYDAAQQLNVTPAIPGAIPFVVDWNNDNRKDLLVGGADGRVMLFLQAATSSDLAPVFLAGQFLTINGLNDLDAGNAASPAVVDLDNDGRKDLVVGTSSGLLLSYLNVGTDVQPELSAAVPSGEFPGAITPLFIDWDADGQRELLISHAGSLNLCTRAEDGTFSATETLLSSRATLADSAARFFVIDLDAEQGKDVFAGFNDGKVTYFRSAGRDYLPSVTQALLDKTAQVQELAGADLRYEAVAAAIEMADLNAAGRLVKELLAAAPAGGELEVAASELLVLLSR